MENSTNGQHIVKIIGTEQVTHDVRRFKVEKPADYSFNPGQATDVSINKPGLAKELRPFTFTSLIEWDHIEFTIKIYNDHQGVTSELGKLKAGDEIILHEVFGTIQYAGKGVFIAGGAGITPFIAILRRLHKDGELTGNKLIFSNKTEQDIILHDELSQILGDNFINTLTQEKNPKYDNRMIDKDYLKEKLDDFSQYFYICGPDAMLENIKQILLFLGVEEKKLVFERF